MGSARPATRILLAPPGTVRAVSPQKRTPSDKSFSEPAKPQPITSIDEQWQVWKPTHGRIRTTFFPCPIIHRLIAFHPPCQLTRSPQRRTGAARPSRAWEEGRDVDEAPSHGRDVRDLDGGPRGASARPEAGVGADALQHQGDPPMRARERAPTPPSHSRPSNSLPSARIEGGSQRARQCSPPVTPAPAPVPAPARLAVFPPSFPPSWREVGNT